MLIVPPELLLYIATASEEKYVYNVAGPAGPAKFEAGVAGYEARAFRGCGVVTSTPFEISDEQDSLQMLQRNTQVGEFYRMRAPSIEFEAGAQHKNYMDIIVYNEESDMHVHIAFEEALKATCVFDENGALAVAENPFKNKDGTAIDYATLVNNNKNGVWMPVSLVIARPFIEHRMMSAVLAVAGSDTGVTLFGPAGARWRRPWDACLSAFSRSLTRPPACARRHADLGEHVGEDDRGPLHVPHEVGHLEVAERDGAARRDVQRLCRRVQHQVLRQGQGDRGVLDGEDPRGDQRAPDDGQRRRRRLPVDARVPGGL